MALGLWKRSGDSIEVQKSFGAVPVLAAVHCFLGVLLWVLGVELFFEKGLLGQAQALNHMGCAGSCRVEV